jgi:outer membrane immunogenic protein
MNQLARGIVAMAALMGTPALAADMALKAPPPAPSPAYDWSGFYIGANGGWERQRHTWAFDPPLVGATDQSWTAHSATGTFGGQVGIQKAWNHLVLGAEYATSVDANEHAWDNHICPNPILYCRTRIGQIQTAGPRLGYAGQSNVPLIGDWLLYATGGWARGSVQTRGEFIATGAPSGDETIREQRGWYAGVGAEAILAKGTFFDLVGGVEYQHVNLGTAFHCAGGLGLCLFANTDNRDVGATADIFRVRLSVKTH